MMRAIMEDRTLHIRDVVSESLPLPDQTDEFQPAAWEMIENGRYQPRRIKGSCLGRELG
jgi:hypothetical protein